MLTCMNLGDGFAIIAVGGAGGLPTPSTVGPRGAVAATGGAAAGTCWLEEPCRSCRSGVTVAAAGGLKTGSFGWRCWCTAVGNHGTVVTAAAGLMNGLASVIIVAAGGAGGWELPSMAVPHTSGLRQQTCVVRVSWFEANAKASNEIYVLHDIHDYLSSRNSIN